MANEVMDNFCALAQQQKGLALVFLIEKALANPKLFFFGELLSVPSVIALSDVDASNTDSVVFLKSYNSLELFAYGTYSEYAQSPEKYVDLNPAATSKLKQLSIISCAKCNKIIPYAVLQKELDIDSVRALEDLIIETMYAGLITGKLNQQDNILRVQSFIGRDVRVRDISNLIVKLEEFKQSCAEQITIAEESSEIIRKERIAGEARQENINESIDQNKTYHRDGSHERSIRGGG